MMGSRKQGRPKVNYFFWGSVCMSQLSGMPAALPSRPAVTRSQLGQRQPSWTLQARVLLRYSLSCHTRPHDSSASDCSDHPPCSLLFPPGALQAAWSAASSHYMSYFSWAPHRCLALDL